MCFIEETKFHLSKIIMKTYLISYDLNQPLQNYGELIEAIKEYSNWWHHLDSVWIIKTEETTVQVRDYLRPYIDSNDELLVVGLNGEGAWFGFNDRGSEWLKNNL